MFRDKVVWVTGASSGLGAALADELTKLGATVILTARREEKLAALRDRAQHPERVFVLPGDLTRADSLAALSQQAEECVGRIDVLINNAGISQRARALDTRIDDVRSLMEVNFFAPVALTNAVLPGMLARSAGHIVTVSSVTGYVGTPLRSSYAASKHALRGYYDSLRAELHGSGVNVTVVCPGYIRTEMSASAIAEGGRLHGVIDSVLENGMDANVCARAILTAVERNKSELYIGGREVLAIYAKRLVPKLVERIVPGRAPT